MKKNILFVCTGNSCRSVMAEGIFKDLLGERADNFWVSSAGVSAVDGLSASSDTIEVMAANGFDVTGHKSRRLTVTMVRTADLILVMERGHKEFILRAWPEAREKVRLLADEEVPDPMVMGGYENTFQVIQEHVRAFARTLDLPTGD